MQGGNCEPLGLRAYARACASRGTSSCGPRLFQPLSQHPGLKSPQWCSWALHDLCPVGGGLTAAGLSGAAELGPQSPPQAAKGRAGAQSSAHDRSTDRSPVWQKGRLLPASGPRRAAAAPCSPAFPRSLLAAGGNSSSALSPSLLRTFLTLLLTTSWQLIPVPRVFFRQGEEPQGCPSSTGNTCPLRMQPTPPGSLTPCPSCTQGALDPPAAPRGGVGTSGEGTNEISAAPSEVTLEGSVTVLCRCSGRGGGSAPSC